MAINAIVGRILADDADDAVPPAPEKPQHDERRCGPLYDPTYAHYITMALYEDRLRLAAADARTRPSPATAVLRELLGRGVRRIARPATPACAPEPAATSCTP